VLLSAGGSEVLNTCVFAGRVPILRERNAHAGKVAGTAVGIGYIYIYIYQTKKAIVGKSLEQIISQDKILILGKY